MKSIILKILFFVFIVHLLGCWASKCPEKTCHVRKEHRHEGANYRSNAPLSWVTTKKNWPWKKNAKKDKAKKEKGGKKQKIKYLLPGEVVNDPKPNDKVEKSK